MQTKKNPQKQSLPGRWAAVVERKAVIPHFTENKAST
jgi:hypothetical protein